MTLMLFIAGIALLVVGAEALVRGASRLAAAAGVSSLVIGLTVVSFGTSAPELAVSLRAALSGQADIALGNVVGSNICNVLLILGLSAAIAPLAVAAQLVRFDVWVMIGVSLLVPALGFDGGFGRLDGLLLIAGFIGYTGWLIRISRRDALAVPPSVSPAATVGANTSPRRSRSRWWVDVLLVLVGLGALTLGANWLVGGAVAFARTLGISEMIVGLTIVAVGTSLPEIATSVIAAVRGERDIAVGNVVGSNIFNILLVLGGSAAVAADGVAVPRAALVFDIPVMVAVAIACLPVFFTGYRIDRWEGILFLAYYVAYVAYLVLDATRSAALPWYRMGLIGFAVPLTVVTLAVITLRSRRAQTCG